MDSIIILQRNFIACFIMYSSIFLQFAYIVVLRHGLRLKQCNKEAVKHAGTYFHFLNVLMAFMLLTVKSKYGFSIFTLSIIKVFSAFSSGIFIYIL